MDLFVTDTRIGRLIDGRYRVESVLARGGMATVYRALDTRLERTVALKIMHPELAADDEFVVRFIGEARSAARLSDPHVVAVFDQGDDDGAVFLAMEYVEGATLREVLREHGRLDAELTLEVTESVLTALSAAHRAGIVHRDVKPENVLVGEDGRVKVADFGLARALSNSSNATQGLLLGTVNYISPEQALGEPATPRSDVYSAGIMLYELLTGFAPHTGPTDFIVVRSHIDQDVPPPSDAVPVPPAVDELVRTATARDPGDRYADAQRFLDALHRVQALLPASGLDDADQTIIAAEPVEAAGVTLSTALQDTMLSSAMVTPMADHAAAIDSDPAHTRIIQPSPAPPPPVGRRAARAGSARPSNHHRQRRSVRGPILFAAVLVIAIAVAGGAWWLGAGRWTSTPSLLNLTPEAAVAKAEQSGLSAVVDGEAFSETVDVGLVVGTDPAPGAKIRRDGEIGLTLSKGPERYEIPDLVGMTVEEATAALEALTLTADVSEGYDDAVEKGRIISQGLPAGEPARNGTAVPIVVSQGREPVQIQDFTGRAVVDAQRYLTDAGFKVVVDQKASDDVAPGVVLSQQPSSGTGYRGDEIRLEVSVGPEAIPVPNVTGMRLREAKNTLEQAGFRVEVQRGLPGWGEQEERTVWRQDPSSGNLPPKSIITIWVI